MYTEEVQCSASTAHVSCFIINKYNYTDSLSLCDE